MIGQSLFILQPYSDHCCCNWWSPHLVACRLMLSLKTCLWVSSVADIDCPLRRLTGAAFHCQTAITSDEHCQGLPFKMIGNSFVICHWQLLRYRGEGFEFMRNMKSAGCCNDWLVNEMTRICFHLVCSWLSAPADLGMLPLEQPAEWGRKHKLTPWFANTAKHNFSPAHMRMYSISCKRTPMTRKMPYQHCCQRCSTWACLRQSFQSIKNQLLDDQCHAVSWPGLSQTLCCLTSPHTAEAKPNQEADVSTRASRLVWTFEEIRGQEPLMPPSLNRVEIRGQEPLMPPQRTGTFDAS